MDTDFPRNHQPLSLALPSLLHELSRCRGGALLPKFLIQNELDRGELVVIVDKPLPSDAGYHLITPVDKSDYPPIVAFRG
jgi:DNA-binding transcriptional LysR family regulator